MPAAIELKNINKRFGPVQANRDVSLNVESGTIHGIIGENGAGKSTLRSKKAESHRVVICLQKGFDDPIHTMLRLELHGGFQWELQFKQI